MIKDCKDFYEITVPFRVSREIGERLEKVRADYVKKHVEWDMESWKRAHPAPDYRVSPIGSDRYDEYCDKLRSDAESEWETRFDWDKLSEPLSKLLEEIIKKL